jgi:hypothetical protein
MGSRITKSTTTKQDLGRTPLEMSFAKFTFSQQRKHSSLGSDDDASPTQPSFPNPFSDLATASQQEPRTVDGGSDITGGKSKDDYDMGM